MMNATDMLLNLLGFVRASSLVQWWYVWGVWVGLLVSVMVAVYIFYDETRREAQSPTWRVLAVVAAIFVLPSLVLRLNPSLAFPNLLQADCSSEQLYSLRFALKRCRSL